MALAKSVTEILSNKTAAASGSTTLSDCTTIDTTSVISLAIEARATYHASATLGVRVRVFASGDDSNYGDSPIAQFDLPFAANTTKRWSRDIIPAEKYMKVQVTNLDTAQSATAIYVYAHAQTA
jgi:hypothetical protein